jgi:hypothetical protein
VRRLQAGSQIAEPPGVASTLHALICMCHSGVAGHLHWSLNPKALTVQECEKHICLPQAMATTAVCCAFPHDRSHCFTDRHICHRAVQNSCALAVE